jgi:hypothetical protein
MGCSNSIFLPQFIILHLQEQGVFTLNQIVNLETNDIWHQGWNSVVMLEMVDDFIVSWNMFLNELDISHIILKDKPYKVVWAKSKAIWIYLTNKGNSALVEYEITDKDWWWSKFW